MVPEALCYACCYFPISYFVILIYAPFRLIILSLGNFPSFLHCKWSCNFFLIQNYIYLFSFFHFFQSTFFIFLFFLFSIFSQVFFPALRTSEYVFNYTHFSSSAQTHFRCIWCPCINEILNSKVYSRVFPIIIFPHADGNQQGITTNRPVSPLTVIYTIS